MMKKVLIGLIIFLALFMASFLYYQAFAEEVKAVILFMQGDVKIKEAGLMEWADAKKGMVLSGGDKLKTGDGSWVEIGFEEDYENAIRIQEETLVELTDLGAVEINLLKGELRALVEKLGEGESFEIRTPMSVCGVRGTGWDTSTDTKKVTVDVYEDSVYFAGVPQGGGAVEDPIIRAGKRGILTDPLKPIVIQNVPAGKMQDWKKWKQDFLGRIGKGIKGKLKGIQQGQKAIEGMMKGKQGIFEKKDKDYMEGRSEIGDKGGYE